MAVDPDCVPSDAFKRATLDEVGNLFRGGIVLGAQRLLRPPLADLSAAIDGIARTQPPAASQLVAGDLDPRAQVIDLAGLVLRRAK
jgi:hypothetical protein